jgi:hypothetical protein
MFLAGVLTLSSRAQGIEPVRVQYSLKVDAGEIATLAVYNPSDRTACVPYTLWPGGEDMLRVVGTDGRVWEYFGLIADSMGEPEKLKIAPGTQQQTAVDIGRDYRPPTGASPILDKVFYGTLFSACLVPRLPWKAHADDLRTDYVYVQYSTAVDANDMLTLTVYNPEDRAACLVSTIWPGSSDNLRVVGTDGRVWNYVGLTPAPGTLKVPPHEQVERSVDIRRDYKPPADASLLFDRVFYGELFKPC